MRSIGIMAAAGIAIPSVALAQSASSASADPVQTSTSSTTSDPQSRPVMTSEGAAVTDVVDAFDVGSVWSFRFTAGYYRSTRTAQLQREMSTSPAMGLGTTMFNNVAHYSQVTQTLNLGAELAVLRDVAVSFGLPIILSDTRGFSQSGADVGGAALLDGFMTNGANTSLFQLPFNSPERSGIDQIRLGLMFNITNQARDPWLPTWLLRFEWRIPVGAPLQACSTDAAGHAQCPEALSAASQPNGAYNPPNSNNYAGTYTRPLASTANPGISRNVHGLYAQTVVARRIGYIEPYIGLDFLLELPASGTDTFRFGDTPFGQLADIPPIQGSLMAGAEITPWENRESWQRFSIDVRVLGKYFSQGRDYSPLFDALGSSSSIPLATAGYAINDPSMTRPIYFTGTTGVQSHGAMTGQIGFAVQPARFLRFSFGGLLTYTTPFLMTATDACNPNQGPMTPGDTGGCVGNSVPDPQHRTVIDAPGQRFRFTDDITWDLYVNVTLTPRF